MSGHYFFTNWNILYQNNVVLFTSSLTELNIFIRVEVTEDGRKALLALSGGDMRRVLNILQSTAMAYDMVNEDNVYLCVGHPLRAGHYLYHEP